MHIRGFFVCQTAQDFRFDSPLGGDISVAGMLSIGEFSRVAGMTVKALRV